MENGLAREAMLTVSMSAAMDAFDSNEFLAMMRRATFSQ
jgi:hypothetical protein